MGGGDGMGNVKTFTAPGVTPFRSVKVGFAPVQAGSGDPSPSNVRAISGWTGLTLYHSGADTSGPVETPVNWTAQGTLYGGTVDIITGVLTVTYKRVMLRERAWERVAVDDFYVFATGNITDKAYNYNFLLEDYANARTYRNNLANLQAGTYNATNASRRIVIRDDAYTTEETFAASLGDNAVVYELAEPQTIQLTPQQLSTLAGVNNLWSNAGDVDVAYYSGVSAMEARRRVLFAGNGPLPPTLRRVEYIVAPGDQAIIDTGVPGNNDNLKFKFCYSVDRQINYRGLFTNYASETANCWRYSLASASGNYLFCTNTRTGASTTLTVAGSIGKKTTVELDKTSGITVSADGATVTQAAPTTQGTANSGTIVINSSRRYARTNVDVTKWYYFKIWDNGVLIRDYVPAWRKADNKAGFYDLVQHQFCPSTGTKDFTLE